MELDPKVAEYFDKGGNVEVPDDVSAEVTAPEAPGDKPVQSAATEEDQTEATDGKEQSQRSGNLNAALHEAREEAKALKRQIAEQQQWRQETERKLGPVFEALKQRENQPQQPAQQTPSFEQDPLAHLQAEKEALKRQLEELKGNDQQRTQAAQQQQQLQQFVGHVQGLKQKFIEATPDYMDAYSHVRDLKVKELTALGYDEQQANQRVDQWEFGVAAESLKRQKNPAEALYTMAQSLGYKKKEAAPANDEKKLEQIAKGQQLDKSLKQSAKEKPDHSLEALASKSEDEIAELVGDPKFWSKLQRQAA